MSKTVGNSVTNTARDACVNDKVYTFKLIPTFKQIYIEYRLQASIKMRTIHRKINCRGLTGLLLWLTAVRYEMRRKYLFAGFLVVLITVIYRSNVWQFEPCKRFYVEVTDPNLGRIQPLRHLSGFQKIPDLEDAFIFSAFYDHRYSFVSLFFISFCLLSWQ